MTRRSYTRGASALAKRFRRAVYELRTEGLGPEREAIACGVGVFIGCTPFYGFHLLITWAVGNLFRLNRLKLYLAANISNPLFAPVLILSELQVGAWLRSGSFRSLTLATVKSMDPWTFGLDILIGSLAVGLALGIFVAAVTYITLRGSSDDAFLTDLIRQTSDRYLHTSLTAWEFARGRLRTDSVYRTAACAGLLRSGRVLVDIGCRQGLMLAFLIDARRAFRAGIWPPGAAAPPEFERVVGVEARPRLVRLARQALGGEAEIVQAGAIAFSPEPCHTVLMLDVLHEMNAEQQESVLAAIVSALDPGGVVLVREANADAGWRLGMVRAINRLGALALGRWRRRSHFRTMTQWLVCFDRLGLEAEVVPVEDGTPPGSVLFRLTVRPDASAASRRPERSR
jgi:uncharacterized protein (DUF2062 family)/2-polyprenyl-3-methyl-5-hydroxy-6-metoxy-1,4-benzoquinol methylase